MKNTFKNQIKIDENDLIKLIMDYLKQKKYIKSFMALEQETNVYLEEHNEEINFLRNMLINGNYEKALSYIHYFQNELETSIFQSILFTIKKAEFFELVDSKPNVQQLIKLSKELQELTSNQQFKQLMFVLSFEKISDYPLLQNWTVESNRNQCFDEIRSHIESCLQVKQKQKQNNSLQELIKKLAYIQLNNTNQIDNLQKIDIFNQNHVFNDQIDPKLQSKKIVFQTVQKVQKSMVLEGQKQELQNFKSHFFQKGQMKNNLETQQDNSINLKNSENDLAQSKNFKFNKQKKFYEDDSNDQFQIQSKLFQSQSTKKLQQRKSDDNEDSQKIINNIQNKMKITFMDKIDDIENDPIQVSSKLIHSQSQNKLRISVPDDKPINFEVSKTTKNQNQNSQSIFTDDIIYSRSELAKSQRSQNQESECRLKNQNSQDNSKLSSIFKQRFVQEEKKIQFSRKPYSDLVGNMKIQNNLQQNQKKNVHTRWRSSVNDYFNDLIAKHLTVPKQKGKLSGNLEKFNYDALSEDNHQISRQSLVSNPQFEKLSYNQSQDSPKSDPLNFDYFEMVEVCKIEDTNIIRAAMFSPNGEYFAIGTNSKAIQIYSFRSLIENDFPQVEMVFEKPNHHQGSIYCLDWSLSGKYIVSGSNDKNVNLCYFDDKDLTFKGEAQFQGHTNIVRSVCFNYDETKLYSGGGDNFIKVWDINSNKLITNLPGHQESVYCLQMVGDGNLLASCGKDKFIKVWDLNSNKLAMNLSSESFTDLNYISVSNGSLNYQFKNLIKQNRNNTILKKINNQKSIVGAHVDGMISFWDLNMQKCYNQQKIHTADCRSVEFNPTGNYICTSSFDYTIGIYDVYNNQLKTKITNHTDKTVFAKWHPFYPYLLTTSVDKTARVFCSQSFINQQQQL